jgi:hypothetical protein
MDETTPLILAAAHTKPEVVRMLLEQDDIDINHQSQSAG